MESVSAYVANVNLTNIEVVTPDEDPQSIYLDLRCTVKKGNKEENSRMVVKL